MALDPDDYRPLYVQLADLLRQQIASGELAPGEMLPSESTLAGQYGIGREAARNALAQLRREGLVRTVRHVGSFVRERVDTRVVRVSRGARVTTRMPTPDERRRHHVPEGVPLLVVSHEGRGDEVHLGDRTIIEVSGEE